MMMMMRLYNSTLLVQTTSNASPICNCINHQQQLPVSSYEHTFISVCDQLFGLSSQCYFLIVYWHNESCEFGCGLHFFVCFI